MNKLWTSGVFVLALCVILVLVPATGAQDADPVVQVALFYSPTCPHCHYIINEFLPPVIEEYGDALEIFYINVQEQAGAYMMYDACNALGVPQDNCGGVPAMVVGNEYLVGSVQIPARMRPLVNIGLANGGLDLSNLPRFWQAYQPDQVSSQAGVSTLKPGTVEWQQRFAADPVGGSIAVAVLIGLVVTLFAVIRTALASRSKASLRWWQSRTGTVLMLLSVAGGLLMMMSLTWTSEISSFMYAAVILAFFIGILVNLSRANSEEARFSLIPAAAIAGLLVAIYLAYVEVGGQEAVCGVVGNCNAVQSSPYAAILGVPIGIIGVVGYVLILIAWGFASWQTGKLALRSQVALLGLSVFGVVFSVYLTFLEPFVIGAVCAWCLTSALTMLVILHLSAPRGFTALRELSPKKRRVRRARAH